MKRAFIINGVGGVGKDTFVNIIRCMASTVGIEVYNVSSVDKVKEAAELLGWQKTKEEKDRKFLHDLKNLVTDYNDGCLKYIKDYYDNHGNGLYFFHIREPKEIEKAVKLLNAETIYIKNNKMPVNNNRGEESGIEDISYTYTVDNSKDFESLIELCSTFLRFVYTDYNVCVEDRIDLIPGHAVAFDFDGVIHKYSEGWKDGTIYDDENQDVVDFMEYLMSVNIPVFILSTRDPKQIIEWWNDNVKIEFPIKEIDENTTFFKNTDYVGVTNRKLPAQVYIDDRALKVTTKDDIMNIRKKFGSIEKDKE